MEMMVQIFGKAYRRLYRFFWGAKLLQSSPFPMAVSDSNPLTTLINHREVGTQSKRKILPFLAITSNPSGTNFGVAGKATERTVPMDSG